MNHRDGEHKLENQRKDIGKYVYTEYVIYFTFRRAANFALNKNRRKPDTEDQQGITSVGLEIQLFLKAFPLFTQLTEGNIDQAE